MLVDAFHVYIGIKDCAYFFWFHFLHLINYQWFKILKDSVRCCWRFAVWIQNVSDFLCWKLIFVTNDNFLHGSEKLFGADLKLGIGHDYIWYALTINFFISQHSLDDFQFHFEKHITEVKYYWCLYHHLSKCIERVWKTSNRHLKVNVFKSMK